MRRADEEGIAINCSQTASASKKRFNLLQAMPGGSDLFGEMYAFIGSCVCGGLRRPTWRSAAIKRAFPAQPESSLWRWKVASTGSWRGFVSRICHTLSG